MVTNMNDNFACFILTYGRPQNINTLRSLKNSGYNGKIFLLCSDDDKKLEEYKQLHENVIVFNKRDMLGTFDKMDNFGNEKCVVYARNKCFDVAKDLGIDYFCMLDDDYTTFSYSEDNNGNYIGNKKIKNINKIFEYMVEFIKNTTVKTVCFAQGGDFIGGEGCSVWKHIFKRKAMNLYIFKADRPVKFIGTINEDTNMYTYFGSIGELFFTTRMLRLEQKQTQSNSGGLTDIYLESGTYVKSFYTVMTNPSSVEIRLMGEKNSRLHHFIKWKNTVPCILSEEVKYGRG